MELIGLMGKIGSGKTTVAQILVNNYGFVKVSFADALKQMLVNAKIITYDEAFVNKTPYAREMLQKIGTDLIRNQIDKDFWVKQTAILIDKLRKKGIDKIVIDDVRFPNEHQFVINQDGIIVKVVDPNGNGLDNHESESYVDSLPHNFLISNDKNKGIPYLERQIHDLLKLAKIFSVKEIY